MAEDINGGNAEAFSSDSPPPLIVNAQYIKDLSFEVPKAPLIFSAIKKEEPDVNINVGVNYSKLNDAVYTEDDIYEVVLGIKATCTAGTETAFLLELEYAGLFTLNVDSGARRAVLLIECPRLLFPFARNILADASREGGFPPLMLGPIDFATMYSEQISTENPGSPT